MALAGDAWPNPCGWLVLLIGVVLAQGLGSTVGLWLALALAALLLGFLF